MNHEGLYTVICESQITDFDYSIVNWLYQPIIGPCATSLYFMIFEQTKVLKKLNLKFDVKSLCATLSITYKEFNEAKEKLEALKLLKTFMNKNIDKKFVFNIFPPLAPHDFFNDKILDNMLLNKIGKVSYEIARFNFVRDEIKTEDYHEMTANFSDVFINDFIQANAKRITSNIKVITKEKTKVINYLDYSILDKCLIEKGVNEKLYHYLKDLIEQLSTFYRIKEKSFATIIIKSIIITKENQRMIDETKLIQLCHNYYEKQLKSSYKPILKQEDSVQQLSFEVEANANSLNIKDAKITEMKTIAAVDYFTLLKEKELTSQEVEIIRDLIVSYKLTNEVVNCLIEYVWFKNNSRIERNYITKIASTLNALNINCAEQAMEYLKKAYRQAQRKIVLNETINFSKANLKAKKLVNEQKLKTDWLNEKPPSAKKEVVASEKIDLEALRKELEGL